MKNRVSRSTYHILIGFAKESVGKNADDENVNNERNQQSYARLDEEIHVRLLH